MPGRRRFLGAVLGGWMVSAISAVIYPVLQYLEAPPMGEREKEVTLTTDDLRVGEAVHILRRGAPVIVIRESETNFLTVSAICTHLGCIVKWDDATQTLECPCHAARFGKDGAVLAGPPQSGLPVFATRVEDGEILIDGSA